MAAYGQVIKGGGTEATAPRTSTPVRQRARAGRQRPQVVADVHVRQGRCAVAYENEAIFAQQNGQDIDYVVPDSTILIENPAAITATSKNAEQAKASTTSCSVPRRRRSSPRTATDPSSTARQRVRLPTPAGLFTIADLGAGPTCRRSSSTRRAASWLTSRSTSGSRWLMPRSPCRSAAGGGAAVWPRSIRHRVRRGIATLC